MQLEQHYIIREEKSTAKRWYADTDTAFLGNRQQIYNDYLRTCRAYYGKTDGSKCDVYEYDRTIMNQRQPQSMQNYQSRFSQNTRTQKGHWPVHSILGKESSQYEDGKVAQG